MNDWLKKNQKKLLAVLGAFLMVSFLITPSMSSLTSRGVNRGAPIGTIGKTILYSDDKRRADQDWQMLAESIDLRSSQAARRMVSPLEELGRAIDAQVSDHPELYMLLIAEAQKRGINVSNDTVESLAKNEILYRGPGGSDSPIFKEAIRRFLMVKLLHDQLLGDVKYTEPMWRHDIADRLNEATLNIVEFNANQNMPTTAPTTREVEDQFKEFSHVHEVDAANLPGDALGFGYETPNRVKLQYLEITRKQAMDAARAAQDPYALELSARKYYYSHPETYTRLAPATSPTTQPAKTLAATTQSATTQTAATKAATTQLATTQAATSQPAATKPALASTQPSLRPYAEVKDEILNTLLEPDAEKLQEKVDQAIHDRLAADYEAYRKANPTTAPTTQPASAALAPATQPATGYASYGYLEKVALDMQRQFNILPEVRQIAEWEDVTQLSKEPGLGVATDNGLVLPEYVTRNTAPFITDIGTQSGTLQLWQPSPIFTDTDKSSFIFRLTAASPAHAPALADVHARVEADVRLKESYDAAKAAAQKFLDSATRDGFTRTALDNHLSIHSAGPFEPRSAMFGSKSIPNFVASPETVSAVASKAQDLLALATTANPRPIALLALPAERKALVLQLSDITLALPSDELFRAKLQETEQVQASEAEHLSETYFDFAHVSARLDYKPEADKNSGS